MVNLKERKMWICISNKTFWNYNRALLSSSTVRNPFKHDSLRQTSKWLQYYFWNEKSYHVCYKVTQPMLLHLFEEHFKSPRREIKDRKSFQYGKEIIGLCEIQMSRKRKTHSSRIIYSKMWIWGSQRSEWGHETRGLGYGNEYLSLKGVFKGWIFQSLQIEMHYGRVNLHI